MENTHVNKQYWISIMHHPNACTCEGCIAYRASEKDALGYPIQPGAFQPDDAAENNLYLLLKEGFNEHVDFNEEHLNLFCAFYGVKRERVTVMLACIWEEWKEQNRKKGAGNA